MLTGRRDEKLEMLEADKRAVVAREQKLKKQAKASAHKRKYRNDETVFLDTGEVGIVLDDESVTPDPASGTARTGDDVHWDDGALAE
jgi:hypothetical protein